LHKRKINKEQNMTEEEFGVIGLGRMGGGLACQALKKNMKVAGYTKGSIDKELINSKLIKISSLKGFKDNLKSPRPIFLYIPAGPGVDELIDLLIPLLEKNDIIIDGGNSYWGDSIRRAKKLKEKGIYFVDLGTSGGVTGARNGACFMAGGEEKAIKRIEPILLKLSVENGYVYAGPSGSGHFTKLVHNGIEFGMMQAIGEGIDLLSNFHEPLKIAEILGCWRNGSVIRSWLIDLMEEQYRKNNGTADISSYVDDTGEVNWLLSDAITMEVPVPAISTAVMQLFVSRDSLKIWAKSIALMRRGFGGHKLGQDPYVVEERKKGRVGDFFNPEKEK
jgi:6-phosphogluconate dehydrogenase